MNSDERKIFWDKLISLKGEDLDGEAKELLKTLKYPPFIYRYRAVNVNTIDCLQTNKLYFSSSAYYDDPFDTYLTIDYKKIYEQLKQTEKWKESAVTEFIQICKDKGIDDKKIGQMAGIARGLSTDDAINVLIPFFKKIIQPQIRNASMSICFAECGINETMWLKYADQYHGFCLMYSLVAERKFMINKQERCPRCQIFNVGTPLYPMYYSDTRYDATKYGYNLAHNFFLRQCYPSMSEEEISKRLDACIWERERVTLIKSKCHEYDQEWRIILPISCSHALLYWVPYGIILGLRTSKSDTDIIIRAAKSAGVKHLFKSYIDDNGQLDAEEITGEIENA